MHNRFAQGRLAVALALVTLGGCRSATDVPPSGAMLLNVSLAAGAQMPDELRASVFDDTGVLWMNQRIPTSGPLVPESASALGTILVQPGTVSGDLRIDLKGLLGGVLVDEATAKVPHASFSGGTFDFALSAMLPQDTDGDGVPDVIDDCPTIPDPSQTGCPVDGGSPDASMTGRDAAVDTSTAADAGTDGPLGNKGTGSGCTGANECASGFCKDGVCCNNACTTPCESCTTGTCTPVKSGEDYPECVAPMTCNGKGKCVAAGSGGSGG